MYVTFCGTNEAKVVDHDSRLRDTTPVVQAAQLWRELWRVLGNDEVAE